MSSTTPLTDNINALTAYSNQVTGASDTNLSDAVERLVDGYGTGGGYEGLEYVYRGSGNTPISEVIWHGSNKIVNSCFQGFFGAVNKNIPISFSEPPITVDTNAFLSSHLKIDWESFGSELLVAGHHAFRIGYVDDCSSQIVRLPKFDGLQHEGVSVGGSFAYTGPKAPGTYYFDTMQVIPREFFGNLSHTNFSATFGSIGHAVQSSGLYPFHNSTAAAVATINVYTTGEYLDTVKTALEGAIGSGAFTFIYKASEATTYNGSSYAAGATILTNTS